MGYLEFWGGEGKIGFEVCVCVGSRILRVSPKSVCNSRCE